MSSKPLIVICGTTGVGKSKLGIELALALSEHTQNHRYNGARIINADSMQVYTGMDVITNKVPLAERCGVEHLLMDYKKPGEQLTGPEWIKDAIEAVRSTKPFLLLRAFMRCQVEETHSRNQVPIVVGGTSYWIQHLIFPERMASLDKSGHESPETNEAALPSAAFTNALASLPPELLSLFNNLPEQAPSADLYPQLSLNLHKLLAHVDPLVSQRWHWRDSRKVLTNLRIIQDNRRLASEVLKEQSQLTSRPRYLLPSTHLAMLLNYLESLDIVLYVSGCMRNQTS